MARIVGGITTSHVPAIGGAIAKGLQNDPYWKPFFDGFVPVRKWLSKMKPDVAVVFYNDHGLNFFLDKMPTFAIGAAFEYENQDEGWGIPVSKSAAGDADLSWHLINQLVGDGPVVDAIDGNKPARGVAIVQLILNRFQAAYVHDPDAKAPGGHLKIGPSLLV